MKRFLIFGDTHMPTRAKSIPGSFHKHIRDTAYDGALVTGDLVKEKAMRAALPPLPECYIVQGNMDMDTKHRFHEEIKIEELQILLLHGSELSPRGDISQLKEIADKVGADVVVHGHTHVPSVDLHEGKLFLNPGTISGATGGGGGRKDASFIELEISNDDLSVVLFVTDWDVDKRSVLVYRKTADRMTQLR